MAPTTDHEYDLVVWGATGVVGQLLSHHLLTTYSPTTVSLALGGRDQQRLQNLVTELQTHAPDWESIPTVLGDATDRHRMREIADQTQVICTTVGPYTSYGTPLVEACVETGTDYCDLTGEVTWIREMIDRYHERAMKTEARIIHSCGFDSIPADLGTLLVQSFAARTFDTPCDFVRIYIEDGSGGVSGSTLASGVEVFKTADADPIARQTLRNPYALAPRGERSGVDSGEQTRPRWDPLYSEWTAPSPMGLINERIIRRTNALLEYPWSREFECTEVVPTGSGPSGLARATAITAGLSIGTRALRFGPTRRLLQHHVFPEPGTGPDRNKIEHGYFTLRIRGRGTALDGPFVVDTVIRADRDPGYGATALMLGEAAMCLVTDKIDSPYSGGVLTPASGIGLPLADQLRDAGLEITTELANELPANREQL